MISTAYANEVAATTAPAAQANPMISFVMLGVLLVFFYFFIWRPQSKRAKEHKSLLENLKIEDNVMTAGGIIGKIDKIEENFVMLRIAEQTVIKMQKSQIAMILPKGE